MRVVALRSRLEREMDAELRFQIEAFGLVGALALTRPLSSLLHGVHSTDAVTFTAVSLLLIVVALLASYVPA
jgi:hypothetical protein